VRRLCDALFPGARVFVPGFSGESALLFDELHADPERAKGVSFTGVQYPGIGRADYVSLHPDARQTGFFMLPAIREGMRRGQAELLPMDYAGIVRHLRAAEPFDVVFAQLSPPDAEGWCSPGVCADFPPLVWSRARRRIAHVNPRMPRTNGSFRVHVSELDASVEADSPLVTYDDSEVSPIEEKIGQHVASLVRDGDTLQFGVGSVPTAVARSLKSHRRLRIYTGMLSGAVRELSASGALDPGVPISTGSAVGSEDFYRSIGTNGGFWFTDAGRTHDVERVAAILRFVAINSAVEVDLFGQVNSERVDGALLSGPGGLPVYAYGALRSPGGRSLICLKSTARQGAVPRIVPTLGTQAICTVPSHLADIVVTEHGIAELRGKSLELRAKAMIAIAAPQHRESLATAWRDSLSRARRCR
jgi:acyl-CoA hydrolase